MAASVIAAAGAGASRLLRNKWFWIILLSIIAFIIIRRYWNKMSTKVGSRLGPQYGDWQEGTITDGRKRQLEQYAQSVYDILACWYCASGGEEQLQKIAYLNDNELEYVTRYYEQHVSDNNESLYHDIDDEWLGGTEVDDEILTRLNRIGLV